ncbi:hypothetical protein BDZ89DRAFT_1084100 [Hymenopellis radicata]|nr:hypothetical protein BDZ89DRAFT_1084100 [Hymenopellis radicata]
MTTECSVCLEPYKDAVSIPCGHIFCSACLQSHIGRESLDGVNAKCPMCQKDFTFLTPDLTLVMKPLHKHIHPSIRRIYVDLNTSETDKLKTELAAAKAQVQQLKGLEIRLKEALSEEKQTSLQLKRELEDSIRTEIRREMKRATVTPGSSSSAPPAKRARHSISVDIPKPLLRNPYASFLKRTTHS